MAKLEGETVASRIRLLAVKKHKGMALFSADGVSYLYGGLDPAVVERIKAVNERNPGTAFNIAVQFGDLLPVSAFNEEGPGDMRRKDQEITNEPSAVVDLAMWPGSAYVEGTGMKKLERVLGEGAMREETAVVESNYFKVVIKSRQTGEDYESVTFSISQRGEESLMGGVGDAKVSLKKVLGEMDAAVERAMSD